MLRFLALIAFFFAAHASVSSASLIAYSTGGGEDNWSIRVVREGGTHDRALLRQTPFGGGMYRGPSGPRWSSDGKSLLFGAHSHLDHEAAVLKYANASGKRIREIPLRLKRPLRLYGWDWAPDGRRVVFAAGSPRGVSRIYTVALDGAHLRRLARGNSPRWAADGRHIVYERGWAGSDLSHRGVFVMRPSGNGVRRLTQSADDFGPSISPDGQKVAYVRRPSPPGSASEREEWRIIDVSGQNDTLVTSHIYATATHGYGRPQWTPDGQRLAAIRVPAVNFPTTAELVTIGLDGADERVEFTMAGVPSQYVAYEGVFDWQPR